MIETINSTSRKMAGWSLFSAWYTPSILTSIIESNTPKNSLSNRIEHND